ncbi:MAG: 50S ribosomal protein L28 [SAR324 cluster bacterium]|uniref:Large ribosomal subunit protein bL28 n=1 Tax=SAR324 cluster bacterium TaxID=2024889 RepID=A0A7X9IKN8_9DELT|nr:50S ribosomal protein L28 [SAR324 cluster bacterium]
MSHRCVISKSDRQVGNRVSHAKNRSKHVFMANIQEKRIFIPEDNKFVRIKVSTRMLRTIDRIGLLATLKKHNLSLKDIAA